MCLLYTDFINWPDNVHKHLVDGICSQSMYLFYLMAATFIDIIYVLTLYLIFCSCGHPSNLSCPFHPHSLSSARHDLGDYSYILWLSLLHPALLARRILTAVAPS